MGGLDAKVDKFKEIESISVVGCGSSFNAATYGAKLLRHTGVFANVAAMDCNSTEEADFRFHADPKKSGLIVLSQSGETREVTDVVKQALNQNVSVFSITNTVGSTVANQTKCGVYVNAGPEIAAPSTKSFTGEVVILALTAMWFRQVKAKQKGLKLTAAESSLAESLQRLPITFGMLMKTRDACKKAAQKLASKEHCFVLGKGEFNQFSRLVLLLSEHLLEVCTHMDPLDDFYD